MRDGSTSIDGSRSGCWVWGENCRQLIVVPKIEIHILDSLQRIKNPTVAKKCGIDCCSRGIKECSDVANLVLNLSKATPIASLIAVDSNVKTIVKSTFYHF